MRKNISVIFILIIGIVSIQLINQVNAFYVVNASERKTFETLYNDYDNYNQNNVNHVFFSNYFIPDSETYNIQTMDYLQNQILNFTYFKPRYSNTLMNHTIIELSQQNNEFSFLILLKSAILIYFSTNSYLYLDYGIQQFRNESQIDYITNFNYNESSVILLSLNYSTTQFTFYYSDFVNSYEKTSIGDYSTFQINLLAYSGYQYHFLAIDSKKINATIDNNYFRLRCLNTYRINQTSLLDYQEQSISSNFTKTEIDNNILFFYKNSINNLNDYVKTNFSNILNNQKLLNTQKSQKYNTSTVFTYLDIYQELLNDSLCYIFDFSYKQQNVAFMSIMLGLYNFDIYQIVFWTNNNTLEIKYLSSPTTFLYSEICNFSRIRIGVFALYNQVESYQLGLYYFNYDTNITKYYFNDIISQSQMNAWNVQRKPHIKFNNFFEIILHSSFKAYYNGLSSINDYIYQNFENTTKSHFNSFDTYLEYSIDELSTILNDSSYNGYIKTSEKINNMNFSTILTHNYNYYNYKNTTLSTYFKYTNSTYTFKNNNTAYFDKNTNNALNIQTRNRIDMNYTLLNNDYRYKIDCFNNVNITINIDVNFNMIFQKEDKDLFQSILSFLDVIIIFFITIWIFARYRNKYLILISFFISSGFVYIMNKIDIYLFIIIEIINLFITMYLYKKYDNNDE